MSAKRHKDPAPQCTARPMTPYLAVAYAEGFADCSEEEYYAAWQYLVDTGMAWQLQGWFGRTAVDLINAGMITR